MPRRRSRFSSLRRRLRDAGGVPSTSAPTDLQEYYKYATGQNSIKVDRAISGASRERLKLSLIPFAVTPDTTPADGALLVFMTTYSYKGLLTRADGAGGLNAFGLSTDTSTADSEDEFFPALIRASYTRSGASQISDKESGVTKKKYKYTPRRNFSFPFGRTTTSVKDAKKDTAETTISDVDELDVAKTLVNNLKNGSTDGSVNSADNKRAISVSYEPELYKPATEGKAAPAASAIDSTVDVD